MSPISGAPDTQVSLPKCTFTNGDLIFYGWATAPDSGKVAADETTIILSEPKITLYALWINPAVNYVTVTFHPQNGTDNKVQQHIEENKATKLNTNRFSYDGYEFSGWAVSSGSTEVKYTDGHEVTLTTDLDLYAVWEKAGGTSGTGVLSFDANGGGGTMDPIYVKSGERFQMPANTFTPPEDKPYHTCNSYGILKSPDTSSTYIFSGFYSFTEDTTLYAYWTPPKDQSIGGASEKYKGQMVWSPGVNIQDGDWVLAYPETNEYFAEWKPDCGWYDASQGTFNFCWAASASNVIHWWLDMNKDNVDKFFTLQNKSTPDFSYAGKGQSKVFALFVEKWRENIGGFTNIGFNWFVNLDDNDAIQPSARGQAAYFKRDASQ